MDLQEIKFGDIDFKLITREIKSKVRKLPSHLSSYVKPEHGIHLIYDNTKYTIEDIKKEVEKMNKERKIYCYVDYPDKIK